MLLCSHSTAGIFPYPPKREQPMNNANGIFSGKGHVYSQGKACPWLGLKRYVVLLWEKLR